MIVGHAHPAVVSAVSAALADGTSFGTATPGEVDLAEEIVARAPVDQVRLVNSGTEATMSAVRLARGVTGRPLVGKFAGGYHRHVDALLAAAGSGAALGGGAEIMRRLARAGPVYQAGTLSGNPLAVAAGLATLRSCTSEVYARVDDAAAAVAKLTAAALTAAGVPFWLSEAGNLFSGVPGPAAPGA